MMATCEQDGCGREGFDCFLPCEDEPNGHFCGEHAAEQGFCCICGIFSAGIESFDFLHPGYCDNCYGQICDGMDDYDDVDLEFYDY